MVWLPEGPRKVERSKEEDVGGQGSIIMYQPDSGLFAAYITANGSGHL
jgi:hypothetical protein